MDGVTESASVPARAAVAAAIVTSHLGVLVGRRRDGTPPWTFPSGKIEPGESQEDTAVRETFEETGLRGRATAVIGRRVHPLTRIRVVYVVAELVDEPGVMAHKSGEFAEVRWVSLAEAEALMGNIRDVRQYLALGA